ncbi:uncharacterized protein LOC129294748 [Prosopis cineraria]|uniref:uncharacterized protein LOC129294748 n=1 Tax=Prosopis cineraria TaxID=364024 RepID=UPI0024103306|nr:uncharacterized protein LOC129294748 [Prosopis cineraria]
MAMCRCFSVFTAKKNANKVKGQASKGGLETLHVKIDQPGISSETDELKAATFDVTATRGIQKNSRCNVRVMNLDSPVKDAEEAYEGEDEHEDSTSIKRELSDMDLQSHANETIASKGGFEPRDDEISFPILYETQVNDQFEDKNDKESHKSIDMIQSGHVSDPGVGRAVFWASPKLKRSCSDLERRDVFRNMTRQLPHSTSQSYEDLQGLSENPIDCFESPKSVMTHCSADRVMLKKHSSSQVLPSRSRRLWWKLFLWSHRNIHRPWFSKSTQLLPANAGVAAASNRQCGYSSDILEPKQGRETENEESPGSYTGESFVKLSIEEHSDNQWWGRFHIGESSMWPQNQWVAFSTESSPFARVDEWVKDLETQEPLPVDGDDDNERSIVYPTSPDTGRSVARSTARYPSANLSKEILYANSIVQSLNPTSSAAHITGIGLNAIPAISHFSGLRTVNLSSNFIVHITPGLLPKGLHTLNLSRNKISTIEGLRELTRLRVLDLSYNRISRIGQGLSNCTLIKELYLAGNKISDSEGLHRLLKLTVLDLSFNKITTTKSLGQLVANFNSLQALNLLGNPIQSNISEEQLRKAVCGLLPKLVYLNKQSIKPQRAREILIDSVAKAALANSSRSSHRRALKRGGQGSLSSSRSSASVVHRSKNRSRSRTPSNQVPAKGTTR